MPPRNIEVTERIRERSAPTRDACLRHIRAAASAGPKRTALFCSKLAHGFAACDALDQDALKGAARVNIAIVPSYNDMLSAHQPLERFPALIKAAVREAGGVAQFAGGVPAMCHGVTQGQAGMGDLVRLDAAAGRLDALVDEADWAWRTTTQEPDLSRYKQGLGRELFAGFRAQVGTAETGAAAIGFLPDTPSFAKAEIDARF